MFQTLIRPSSGACDYLLRCVGWLEACWCYVAGLSVGDVVSEYRLNQWSVVVQPTLRYHITNRQSRYITPARLKSGTYSSCIYSSIQMHKTPKHTTHKHVQELQDTTRLQKHTHSEPHTTHNIGIALRVVVQPTLGYHITNRQSCYITPAHLKSAYTTQQTVASSWRWTYCLKHVEQWIIKRVSSSWSTFIQISRWCTVQYA